MTEHKPWSPDSDRDWVQVTKEIGFRRSQINCVERITTHGVATYNQVAGIDASDATDYYPRVVKYRVYANGLMREFEGDAVYPGALNDFLPPLESL